MKYLILCLILVLVYGCDRESAEEKFKRECPYPNLKYSRHLITIPVTVSPNKLLYEAGDTINISATFSNVMFDYNTKQNFTIKKFPFDIGVKLWKFANDSSFQNGFRVNEYIIDTSYFQFYDYGGDKTDVIYLDFDETENEYKFDMKIRLKTKGRYILQFEDFIRRYPEEIYAKRIFSYKFEGKCPTFGITPVSMIQGDDHLAEFEKELVYIDKKLYFDNWRSLKYKNGWQSPYGDGSFDWEFVGTYGFEVK